MIPPWQAHPDIPRDSIGWRMGDGEDYGMQFGQWFRLKDPVSKARYASENPEPKGWEGFYAAISD